MKLYLRRRAAPFSTQSKTSADFRDDRF